MHGVLSKKMNTTLPVNPSWRPSVASASKMSWFRKSTQTMSIALRPNAFAAMTICDRVKSNSRREGVRTMPVSAQSWDLVHALSLNLHEVIVTWDKTHSLRPQTVKYHEHGHLTPRIGLTRRALICPPATFPYEDSQVAIDPKFHIPLALSMLGMILREGFSSWRRATETRSETQSSSKVEWILGRTILLTTGCDTWTFKKSMTSDSRDVGRRRVLHYNSSNILAAKGCRYIVDSDSYVQRF